MKMKTRDGGEVEGGERAEENDLAFLACLLCLPMPQTTPRDIYSTRRGKDVSTRSNTHILYTGT